MKYTNSVLALALSAALSLNAIAETVPPWGEPNHGLVTRIATGSHRVTAGQPIVISYCKKNLSKQPLRIWHSGFWPNHRVRVCDAAGRLLPMTPDGATRSEAFDPGGARDKNFPIDLASGADDCSEGGYDMTKLYRLETPGLYSIQYLYEEAQGGWEGQAWSNVLIVEIVPNPARESL